MKKSSILSDAVDLAGVDPIAAVIHGSDLYNTKIDHHDTDVAVITFSGPSRQIMDGDLDVHVVSLESLLRVSPKGYLYETEAALALMYGHGEWYGGPYEAALRSYRPSIWRYATAARRLAEKTPEARKHIIRYEIFLKRFWETGNANPRLSDKERQQWLIAGQGQTSMVS